MEFISVLIITVIGVLELVFNDGGQGIAFIISLGVILYALPIVLGRHTYLTGKGNILLIINVFVLIYTTEYIFYGIDLLQKLNIR